MESTGRISWFRDKPDRLHDENVPYSETTSFNMEDAGIEAVSDIGFGEKEAGHRPVEVERTSSFDDASTGSGDSARLSRPLRSFPPPIGLFPTLVQPQKAPLRSSMPMFLRGRFLPSRQLADRKEKNLIPDSGGSASLGQPIPRPKRAAPPPIRPPSNASGSSYEEVFSSTSNEFLTSVSRVNATSFTPTRKAWPVQDSGNMEPGSHVEISVDSESDDPYFSDAYEPDPLESKWRALEEKRDEVSSLRGEITTTRGQVKQSREAKDAADNAFMALLRPLLVKDRLNTPAISPSLLEGQFRAIQNTRTAHQTLEQKLETQEGILSHAEDELNILERQLINELRGSPSGPPAPRREASRELLDNDEAPSSRASLLGIPAQRLEDIHPLYTNFMSAIGDLQLAQEHHQDLLLKKDWIEQEQETLRLAEHYHSREAFANSRRIRDDDLEFLRDFNSEEREALDEIDRLQTQVGRLKEECIKRKVMPKHAPFHEIYTFEADVGDDMSIDTDTEKTANSASNSLSSRFSILLSKPQHIMGDIPLTAKAALRKATKMDDHDPQKPAAFSSTAKEFYIENLVLDSKENDKSDFINR